MEFMGRKEGGNNENWGKRKVYVKSLIILIIIRHIGKDSYRR